MGPDSPWYHWFFEGPMSWNKTPRNSWMTRCLGDLDVENRLKKPKMKTDGYQKSHERIDEIDLYK